MNKSGIADQVISHPQGGGAIQGLGESFSPDLHTGTGNLTVPIATPPGRNKFQPDLSLLYSTGQGNGLFGLGWSLSIPGVARETSDGVPAYSDDDLFVLSGAERLVPTRPSTDGAMLYRPRTEGNFARISHYLSAQDDYWEVRSRNGLTSLYGHRALRGTDSATVRDPDDPLRVFSWRLTETTDPFGNRIEYLYERDSVAEDGPHRWDQLRLKTIRYANYGSRDAPQFLITVDFVYEPRPDPFSSYRAGFEIRTTQRCTRIEIRTHADADRLLRVYSLTYQDQLHPPVVPSNGMSLLRRVEVVGVDGETREAMPPLDFGYTSFDPSWRVYRPLAAVGDAVPERSLTHPDFELADLFGRGLPDVVQIGEVNRYWRNLGEGRFDVPRALVDLPPGVRLGDQGTQLADFDGDGQIDLLVSRSGFNGYLPLTAAAPQQARPFVSYSAAPPFSFADPELRLMDLDGDGITDALRTGTEFELYHHDRELGWTGVELRSRDKYDLFPDVHFSDPRVKLADMTGSGLQDIVFVTEGHVDYWPYLGGGRWGRRITMGGRLEFPDALAYGGRGFDPKRVLLGDIDGDGVADLVYVESGRVTIWLNRSGNGWSDPIVIHGTPPVSDVDAVRLADVFGSGTAGILWTYDVRSFADSTYKFLDLAGGTKPYLLNERNNNGGARTLIEYAPSTRFYVEDERQPETRWHSRLPFPVQVVARVEVIDEISGGKLTTEYRYHHGYWDGEEREFRGFGMVEQLDSETFARYNAEGLHGPQSFTSVDSVHFSPPTLSRTWFHQGQVADRNGTRSESVMASTPWSGDKAMFSPDQRVELSAIARTAATTGDPLRIRHALRALRGCALRSELYALDDSPHRDRPYTVSEFLYDVREIEPDDPGATGRLRIFFAMQIANRTTQWERGSDPMTQLSFTGGYDAYGFSRTQLAVAVPRGRDPLRPLGAASEPYLSTYSVTEYSRRDDAARFIVDRVARTTGYEVLNDGRPGVFALRDEVGTGSIQLRVISHARTFYDGEAFVGLPLGQIGDFGAAVRAESLIFTDEFLASTFAPNDPLSVSPRPCYLVTASPVNWTAEYPADFRNALAPLAGYVHYADNDVPGAPGGYFTAAGRHRYDFHEAGSVPRGLLRVTRDALGADATIESDTYGLLPVRVTDPLGLVTVAQYDYRTLQAQRIVDPNGNASEFRFSPSGFVTEQYVRGKNGEGDATNPSMRMEYEPLAFVQSGTPMSVRSIRRVHHDSETDVPSGERAATIETVDYSDGFGRLLQKRTRAEDTLFGHPAFGGAGLPSDQSSPVTSATGRTRQSAAPINVVVDGWQVYDNKGRVVEKYEPFFAQGWDYLAPTDAQLGQKVAMFYDARGQLVRTLNPDGSEQRVILGVPSDLTNPATYAPTAWETYTYDANDNAGRTHGNAASAFSSHWNTPSSIVIDVLGRTITAIVRNGPNSATDWYTSRSTYDIQGNLLSVTDALGRTTFRHVFDLAKRRWRTDSIDGGRRDSVPDVLGNAVEGRDSKGALILHSYDLMHRPSRIWARDVASVAPTLGSTSQPAADRDEARANNLLGHTSTHHDEAGLTTIAALDFKGNFIEKSRRVIADAPILAVFNQASANNWRITPFQVDWQPTGQQSLADVEAALLESRLYTTSVTYDGLNRIKSLQFPQDVEGRRRVMRPVYNSAGGLESISLDGAPYVERIAYDAKGQRVLIAYSNGVMTRHAYDPRTFRLKRLRSERYTKTDAVTYAPTGGALQDYAYEYDLIGNMFTMSDRAPGSGILNNPDAASIADPALAKLLASGDAMIRRFTYDPLYRLLSATGRECDRPPDGPPWTDVPRSTDLTKARAYTEIYHYDAMGNVQSLQHQSGTDAFTRGFTIESASNRLQSMQIGSNTYAYTFDASGNMRSETTSRRFEWSQANRMKAFATQTDTAEPSVYAHYLYDGAGQRVKKLVRKQGGQAEVTHYIDAVFEHRRWGGQAGENNHLHVMDDQQRICLVRIGPAQAGGNSPPIQYQFADHLGSSNIVVDSGGAAINREEFTPYGETSFGSYAKKRYRFTGKERDEESGLDYHTARYRSAATSRWLSCDPVGQAPSQSRYEYCAGNPLRFSDLRGESPESADDVFYRLDTDRSGKIDATEVINGTECINEESLENFLLTARASRFTQSGLLAREVVLQPYFAKQAEIERRIEEGNRKAVFMWEDGSQSTREQREDYLRNEEFYNGAEIRTGLGFGAIYYGFTHDRNGAQILNGLGAAAGGMAADRAYYQGVGESIRTTGPAPTTQGPPSSTTPRAAPQRPPSTDEVLLQLRTQATDLTRRISASSSQPLTPQMFGSVNDAVFKAFVKQAIEDGILPPTIRTAPASMNRPGTAGIDVWDTATGVGWDLMTAKNRSVLSHDAKYLNRTAPDGTVIRDVRPLVYSRQ
jgi:RHS repeat-associated protein